MRYACTIHFYPSPYSLILYLLFRLQSPTSSSPPPPCLPMNQSEEYLSSSDEDDEVEDKGEGKRRHGQTSASLDYHPTRRRRGDIKKEEEVDSVHSSHDDSISAEVKG